MVKTVYNLTPGLAGDLNTESAPPPPPLPEYDPEVEPPKWNWFRWRNALPKLEKRPDIPRVGGNPESDDKPDWRGVIKDNIVPMPKVEPYEMGPPQDRRYFFFDTPDYADPFKKLRASLRFFCLSGCAIASCMGAISAMPFTYASNRSLFIRYTIPWVMGGMAYSLSVITVANLRGNKDDMKNYIAAGLVAGCVTGRASYLSHFRHTIMWTSAGTFVKYNAETNGVLALRMNPNARNVSLSGNNAEGGILTGNFNLINNNTSGDPGRDVRRFA